MFTSRIFSKLRSSRPEAMSSTSATAISATTSAERSRAWPLPARSGASAFFQRFIHAGA